MHVRFRAGHHHAVDARQQFVEVEPIAEGRNQNWEDACANYRSVEILAWRGQPCVLLSN
jgi:hypothetical protein